MADGASIASGVKRSVQNPAPFGDCKRCDKVGFPILPLRFAYTPRSAVSEVGSANLSNQDYSFRARVLGMRILSQGFLYVLDERGGGSWRAFQVSTEGSLSEFQVAIKPEQVDAQCRRSDHATRSATFSVQDPNNAKRIWVAYFSVWQTEHQLQLFDAALLGKSMPARLEDDPEVELGNLKARFQEFSVPELTAGARSGEVAHEQADALGLDLGRVKDYAPEFGGRHALYKESVTPGADRSSLAKSIAHRMAAMQEGGGVVVYLHDPIGIAMEIRHLSNLKRLQIEQINQKHRRGLAVKQILDQLGKSWKAGGADRRREWVDDYLSKIDSEKFSAFEKEYDAEMAQRPTILSGLCDDVGSFQKGWALRHAFKHDFDVADADSTVEMVCQMATVMGGGPHGEIDRRHALQEFERPVEDNLWYWAITAGQKSLLQALVEDKPADVQGAVKSAYSVFDAWLTENEHYQKQLRNHLAGTGPAPDVTSSGAARRGAFRAGLAMEDALKNLMTFGQAALSDASVVSFKHTKVFAMAGALWFRTAVQPFIDEVTVADHIRDNKQSAWGHTLESRLQHSVDADGVRRSSINVADVTDELTEAGRKKMPLLRIHWGEAIEIDSLSGDQARRVSQELNRRQRRANAIGQERSSARRASAKPARAPLTAAMESAYEELRRQQLIEEVADRVRKEVAADAARVNRAKTIHGTVSPIAISPALGGLPRATATGWSTRTIAAMKKGGTTGALAAWAMAFQGIALLASVEELLDKPSADALAKVSASMLGFFGAGFELTGAGATLRSFLTGKNVTVYGVSSQAISAWGGVIGGVAGAITGVLTVVEGYGLYVEGDEDAGLFMVGAGSFLTVSGIGTTFGGMAVLGMIGGGPVVWAILAVGAAIVGLYLLVSANAKRDNSLQIWIRSCIMGKMPTYLDENEERAALEKVFEIPFSLAAIWKSGRSFGGFTFGGTVEIAIEAPDVHVGKGWLEHAVSLQMKDGRIIEVRSERFLISDIRAGLNDPHRLADDLEYQNPGLSAPRSGSSFRATSAGGVAWTISYVADSLKSVQIFARFWPNKENNIGLILPGREGITRILTAEG